MIKIESASGEYVAIQQDDSHPPDRPFGNFVVYKRTTPGSDDNMVAVWDEWSAKSISDTISGSWPNPIWEPLPPSNPILARGVGRIQVTSAADGIFANRGYSYWSQAWRDGTNRILCFAGHPRGEQPPDFFIVDIPSKTIYKQGPLIRINSEGEGWYFDPDGWVYVPVRTQLQHWNPTTGNNYVVFNAAEDLPQFSAADISIWQPHSAEDTHSATILKVIPNTNGNTEKVGTFVWRNGEPQFFPARGELDESALAGPDWLIIKETPEGAKAVNNRIIYLPTGEERTITNSQGAVGHSDAFDGIVIGEWSPQNNEDVGQCVKWELNQAIMELSRRSKLFDSWNVGHLSCRAGKILQTDVLGLSLVSLDGSGVTFVSHHGMTINPKAEYETQVFANLDHTGTVAAYLSNDGSDRLDLFLQFIP